MSVEDLESHPFELNISLSVSQADLGPTFGQLFFFVFLVIWNFFVKICAHSEGYRNTAGIFGIQIFNGNIAFPIASAVHIPRLFWGEKDEASK